MLKIYMTCPVKNATEQEKVFLENYVVKLESKGYVVHYPARDTAQTKDYRVFETNIAAIKNADEIHVFWNGQSMGSCADVGKAFALGKPIRLINYNEVCNMPKTVFTDVLIKCHKGGM